MQRPLLEGVFGSIDGLDMPHCQVSSDFEMGKRHTTGGMAEPARQEWVEVKVSV